MPYYMRKHFALALLMPDVKVDLDVLGAGLDTALDITAIADTGLFLGYAHSFMNDALHVGLAPKFVGRVGGSQTFRAIDIAQGDSFGGNINDIGGFGAGIDFDLGVTYVIDKIPFGLKNRASLVVNNMLATSFPIANSKGKDVGAKGVPGLPRTLSFGWYTAFNGVGVIENFHFVFDIAEIGIGGENDVDRGGRGGSFFKHVNFGVEAPVKGWFVPRTGFHQGNLTAGFGIRLRLLQFDYAWFAEELMSGVGRLTARTHEVRLALGIGTPALPPVIRKPIETEPAPFEAPKPESTPIQKPQVSPQPTVPEVTTPKTTAAPSVTPNPKMAPKTPPPPADSTTSSPTKDPRAPQPVTPRQGIPKKTRP
jgi:hypothetical protein